MHFSKLLYISTVVLLNFMSVRTEGGLDDGQPSDSDEKRQPSENRRSLKSNITPEERRHLEEARALARGQNDAWKKGTPECQQHADAFLRSKKDGDELPGVLSLKAANERMKVYKQAFIHRNSDNEEGVGTLSRAEDVFPDAGINTSDPNVMMRSACVDGITKRHFTQENIKAFFALLGDKLDFQESTIKFYDPGQNDSGSHNQEEYSIISQQEREHLFHARQMAYGVDSKYPLNGSSVCKKISMKLLKGKDMQSLSRLKENATIDDMPQLITKRAMSKLLGIYKTAFILGKSNQRTKEACEEGPIQPETCTITKQHFDLERMFTPEMIIENKDFIKEKIQKAKDACLDAIDAKVQSTRLFSGFLRGKGSSNCKTRARAIYATTNTRAEAIVWDNHSSEQLRDQIDDVFVSYERCFTIGYSSNKDCTNGGKQEDNRYRQAPCAGVYNYDYNQNTKQYQKIAEFFIPVCVSEGKCGGA